MKKEVSIVWFRQDLRLSDNPALAAAAQRGQILPIYIFDDCAPDDLKMGSVSKIWLHHSLEALNESLKGSLNLYAGKPKNIIKHLIQRYKVDNVFCNRSYESWLLAQEGVIKKVCSELAISFQAFNGNYLYNPDDILKNDGSYYKVFTAYKNKAYATTARSPLSQLPDQIACIKDTTKTIKIQGLNLLPKKQWYQSIEDAWEIGEIAAQKKLDSFIKNGLEGYKEGRDYPSKDNVSTLSPHLHFGEISPSQVVERIGKIGSSHAKKNDIEHFCSEMMWREFSSYLLYHFKDLPTKNFNSKFNAFSWSKNSKFLQSWKDGNTGYPLVDAGMRELLQTGYMHNRVRMIVASFLIKNLNIHWSLGMLWFWERLVDADLANNSASWQWVAGSGVDAAPYFRIFNPVTQGEKFDKDGDYTKKFVPELKNMPPRYLFKPWTAPAKMLQEAGVVLGKTYPHPIVDLAQTRKEALERYKKL